jgi:hypothetical protein
MSPAYAAWRKAWRNSEAHCMRVFSVSAPWREKLAEYAPAIAPCSAVLLLLLVGGCGSAQTVNNRPDRIELATPVKLTPKQMASVRAGLARRLNDDGVEAVSVGRALAGRTSTSVIVCGYLNWKNRTGEEVRDRPFHGLFLGMDNASGFIVTGTGGAENETAATLDVCRRSGLELPS